MTSSRAKLPSVQEIDRYLKSAGKPFGKEIREAVNKLLHNIRGDEKWLASSFIDREAVLARILDGLEQRPPELTPVINATGSIAHTNLGRSILSREIWEAAGESATNYVNLEFSLETGKRGRRAEGVVDLFKTLLGAEDVLTVNNNASAVLLSLRALGEGKEIIVSRGELVEIGGSFRIPEIVALSGGVIREVGTTNKTRLEDYKDAITENTAILLKVHPSNYKIVGFAETTSVEDLSSLAVERGVILIEDVGSGSIVRYSLEALNEDPHIPTSLKNGADIVTFSGDKLLGGPQAGIIAGKTEYVQRMKTHPLHRALRCDKITLELLRLTALAYARGEADRTIPTQTMLNKSAEKIRTRAESVLPSLDPNIFKLAACFSAPGGGALPTCEIPSFGIEIRHPEFSANRILEKLRRVTPPVIARIREEAVLLDFRTVASQWEKTVQTILAGLFAD